MHGESRGTCWWEFCPKKEILGLLFTSKYIIPGHILDQTFSVRGQKHFTSHYEIHFQDQLMHVLVAFRNARTVRLVADGLCLCHKLQTLDKEMFKLHHNVLLKSPHPPSD